MDNILRRLKFARTRAEFEALQDEVSPSRHLLDDEITRALAMYEYNVIGACYLPWDDAHPEMRDHFLPHAGLIVLRKFEDPRVMTQIHQHSLFHCFWGWPIPVDTTYNLYRSAAFVGEVLATMESEYGLFERFPKQTEGMFNPAYPSTFQAFQAVGILTMKDAVKTAIDAQFRDGLFGPEIYNHENFKGGVAITLHRQSAWAAHDDMWCELNWTTQHEERVQRVHRALWEPERHKTIFNRHSEGRAALLEYARTHDFDDYEHLRATLKSMFRIMLLDAVEHTFFEEIFAACIGMFEHVRDRKLSADMLGRMIGQMANIYDVWNKTGEAWQPMPLWNLALAIRPKRLEWEEDLKLRVAAWRDVQDGNHLRDGHYL